jgi:stage II sporulation protein P
MLLVGSDDSGLEHPNWRQNMALALYLQNAAVQRNPTLMRPISLVRERYNQQLCPGMLILEVGSAGNTLQEALAGTRLFANAIAPALTELLK